jgi:hypothetical protein
MGWSSTAMAARYQHVTDPIRHTVAAKVGGLLWAAEKGLRMAIETCQLRLELRLRRPAVLGPSRESGHLALSEWRRMRDSNPRGREPNPLSESAGLCF